MYSFYGPPECPALPLQTALACDFQMRETWLKLHQLSKFLVANIKQLLQIEVLMYNSL